MFAYLALAAAALFFVAKRKKTSPNTKAVFAPPAGTAPASYGTVPSASGTSASAYTPGSALSPFSTPKARMPMDPVSDSPIAPAGPASAPTCADVFKTLSPDMQKAIAGLSNISSRAAVISLLAAQAESDGNPQAAACIRSLA